MAVLKMAQVSNNANTNSSSSTLLQQQNQRVKPTTTMFHDFLGMKATDSPVVNKPTDGRVSSSFGRGGPISSTSDLASGQVGNHLEGILYYGPRSEISGPEISNRLVGSKRRNSDLAFMGHESLESLHLMKMLHNGAGGERPRRSKEDEVLLGMQSMRPSSASLLLQAPSGSRPEGNTSKWEQSVPLIGSAVQYGSLGGHFVPFMHQADVIMGLAGSNGGSWSTTYWPKSATRPASENYAASGEPEAVGSMSFSRDFQGRITVAGNTSQGTGSGERISIPTGIPQGTIVMAKEARNPVQVAEPSIDDKREV